MRGVATWDGFDEHNYSEDPPTEWAMLQCDRCRRVSLQVREDFGEGYEADEPGTVYPSPKRLSWHIPEDLRRECEEARTCFEAKAFTATVVMVGRTLEGTCIQNGANAKTLQQGLKALQEKGLLDGAFADWADALRVLRNQGAHYTEETVSREDAEDALEFVEALLDHLYVFRKRFADFLSRRNPAAISEFETDDPVGSD